MEITRLTDTSIRIKTKTATFVVDPNLKTDADVTLIMQSEESDPKLVENARLVIDGPGDYEVMDVAITGIKYGDFVGYSIDDGSSKILIVPSTVAEKEKDEEGYTALIIKGVLGFDLTKVSSYSADICLVFGDQMNLDHATESAKVSKINIRKIDETLKGQVVVLRKE
jgi:hypothetical protein